MINGPLGLPGRVAGIALCLAVGVLVQHSSIGRRLDDALLDGQMRLARILSPKPVARSVVVVGIDEASVREFPEPITLWHKHLGGFLQAAAVGRAAAVGLDIVLPERSYDSLLPGYDEALLTGILAARRQLPVVLAVTIDSNGKPRQLMRKFQLVAGESGIGLALFPNDPDHVIRRFDEHLADDGGQVPTMVGQMARSLGKVPGSGIIDYSLGDAFGYIPFHQVLGWLQAHDEISLRRAFEGKSVLLGSVLPSIDRVPQPLNLAAWEENANLAPGVLVHAQALRCILADGLIQPLPAYVLLLSILLIACLWGFSGRSAPVVLVLFSIWLCVLLVASVWLFRQGWYAPASGSLAAGFVTLLGMTGQNAIGKLRERRLLRRSFSGSVSPTVMGEILSGKFSPELGGERKYVCVLFADIRGFTAMSESMPPEQVIGLLNRYFSRVVEQIHQADGAVISFMGDGIMAVFGAPKPLSNPCASGFVAAMALHQEVEHLNRELQADGMTPIQVGVGLHAGEVVMGHVGSTSRHDYTAIGDVTNVASRLEGLTKDLGFCIICSEEVAAALPASEDLMALGRRPIKGHAEVEVFGWNQRNFV